MTSKDLLPWTESTFDAFFSAKERRAHAYILAGHSGLGKTVFAQHLAKSLLCKEGNSHACGKCQSCRLFESGSHPDLHVLQSEKRMVEVDDTFALYAPRYLEDENKRKKRKNPSAIIAIDQIRAVIPDVNTRPHISACRIIILNGAEDLNINAANSLLKSLEEPPSDSYFLLISHNPAHLLPTIRSRCSQIDFRVPEKKQAIRWLESKITDPENIERFLDRASGIPIRALEIATGTVDANEKQLTQIMLQLARRQQDPASTAAEMIKSGELGSILEDIQRWFSRLIRLKVASQNNEFTVNISDKPLIDIGNRLNFRQMYAFLDKISNSKKLADGPLNAQLALEDDLISWQTMFSKKS